MKRFIRAWLDGDPPAPRLDGPLCELPAPLPLAEAGRVLVFAPHPDDESIACGGLLLLLARAGVPTRVVLVSDGAGAGGLPPGAAAIRQQEFQAALATLGVEDFALLGFPDGGLVLDEKLQSAIDREVSAFAPHWIFGPAAIDLHRDHRVVSEALRLAALRQACVGSVWQYETWSPLPVTHVLDISEVLAAKLAAVAEHRTALACGNYLQGTEGLARHRGLLLGAPRPGAAAEGFVRCERAARFAAPRG